MNRIIALLFLISAAVPAQESGLGLYDGPLVFRPLVANTFEPRVGLIWHANDNRLRLDIGNSIDLLQYRFDGGAPPLTFGADFFTYTLLRGEKNFHFPVDAVDYLFGLNASYRDTTAAGILSARLRLSHISAHFVDGHFDNTASQWKDGLSPRIYSREFFDLTVAIEPADRYRIHVGALYLWHTDPTSIPAFGVSLGGDAHASVTPWLHPFAAYQFSAAGLRPRHEAQAGVKFGTWNGRGTELFLIHHTGNSIHGEYYDRREEYSGFGMNIGF
ncbi:MAG: DUF1207 domain-containing protein [Bacteroidetes bacterium]|nr:MAG: DUF1207 domain-containing protein [Bacteroidota bacterium]